MRCDEQELISSEAKRDLTPSMAGEAVIPSVALQVWAWVAAGVVDVGKEGGSGSFFFWDKWKARSRPTP